MKWSLAILLVSIFFAVGCNCEERPPSVYIEISPIEPCVGETVTFIAASSDPEGTYGYHWESNIDGVLSNSATFSTSSLSEGTHTITLLISSSHGTASGQRTLRVVARRPDTPPIIEFFNANPERIDFDTWSTLSWRVSGAGRISIDQGIGDVWHTGTTRVRPAADTTYTLTATNDIGKVTASVQVRVIVLPVIESFTATPDSIEAGSSSTLSWTVRNATGASLSAASEPGSPGYTQTVNASGSQSVSPTSTTFYTLTARNAFGSNTATVQVTVWRRPAPEGNPDLVITDIRKAQSQDGYRISYTIKNQGAVVAGANTTKVYASGRYWDSDSVATLQPGMWVTREFSGKLYNPAYNTLEVRADADNAVREGNEQNNSKQVVIPLDVGYDFVANAGGAGWRSGPQATNLSFGDTTHDDRGFVRYLDNARMEDGRTYTRVLVTHPKWVNNGSIEGWYAVKYAIRPGDHFVARGGIVSGYNAGRVRVKGEYVTAAGIETTIMFEDTFIYNGNIETVSYRFPTETYGRTPVIKLIISTDGESTQDWAGWIEAMIVR